MILEETINKALRDIVNLLLGVPDYAIKSRQIDAPRPNTPYCDVGFFLDQGIGIEQSTFSEFQSEEFLTHTVEGMREITMSLGFYRDSAIDNARRVRTAIVRESARSLLSQAGLGIVGRSEVRLLSESLENSWEERAQFDIILSAVGTDADIIASILSVDIAGEFQARGLKYNFDIEVN